MIAAGSFNKSIGFYDLASGTLIDYLPKLPGGITQLEFSADGLRLYVGMRKCREIHCYDLRHVSQPLILSRNADTQQRLLFSLHPQTETLYCGNRVKCHCLTLVGGSMSSI
jgi:hypothetical protein